MTSKTVHFLHHLGENDILVEATCTPGVPAQLYGPPEDCYPEEPAEVEINDVRLVGVGVSVIIDIDGLMIAGASGKMYSVEDSIKEKALLEAEERE